MAIIYVSINFTQNQDANDVVIASNKSIVKVDVESEDFYKDWIVEDEAIIEAFEYEMQTRQSLELQQHIYDNYSLQDQTQDQLTISRSIIKLAAMGVADVEEIIVTASDSILSGETLENALTVAYEDVDEDAQTLLQKAIICFVKSEWVEQSITESDSALSESRLAELPEFPEL